MEPLSIAPPALVRSASQPNPVDSYLYSPFKTATTTDLPQSDRKPPRAGGSSVWADSFRDHDGSREAEGFAREAAPVWLSRNDSASSSSSYGGGSRPLSYGSVGETDGRDSESLKNLNMAARPVSGRRALPLAPISPLAPSQNSGGYTASHRPLLSQTYESDHDRRPIHSLRSPAAAAAAANAAAAAASASAANAAISSASNEQVTY